MSAGILDVQSLLVFLCAQQWQELQSRIPVTFEVVRIDTLSVATETSLPAPPVLSAPTRMSTCACSCAQAHTHTSAVQHSHVAVNLSVTTFTTVCLWNPSPRTPSLVPGAVRDE